MTPFRNPCRGPRALLRTGPREGLLHAHGQYSLVAEFISPKKCTLSVLYLVILSQKVYTFRFILGNIIPKSVHFQFYIGQYYPPKCTLSVLYWVILSQEVYTFSFIWGNIIPKSVHFQLYIG